MRTSTATLRLLPLFLLLSALTFPAAAAPPGDDVEVRGIITTLGDHTVTVVGYTFFVTDDTEIEGPDGEDLSFSDLELGMLVEVEGEYEGDDLVAEEIEVRESGDGEVEVEGVITTLGDHTVTVGGITFLVTDATEIEGEDGDLDFEDLHIGMFAEVEGHYRADGTLVADEIEADDEGEVRVEVEGFIEALGDQTLTVGGLTFLVTDATQIEGGDDQPLTFGDLAVGLFVEVEGHYRFDGALVADEIEVEIEDDEDVEVRGAIEALGDDFLVVAGVEFVVTDATVVVDDNDRPIPYSTLQLGQFVEVHGRFEGDALVAVRIELEDELDNEVRAQAALDAVEPGAVVLLGRAFLVTDATLILGLDDSPIALDALAPGDVVEVEADRRADGTLVAFSVEREDASPSRVELRAGLDAVGPESITVLDVFFRVDAATVILDDDDDPIGLDALVLGSLVDVEAVWTDAGLLATRIEVRRAIQAAGRLTASGGGTLSLPGLTAALPAGTLVLDVDGTVLQPESLSAGQSVRFIGEATASGATASRVYVVGSAVTAVEPGGDLPVEYTLSAVYPNPFNPSARFTLSVAQTQAVTVAVYDALGRRVALLHEGPLTAGTPHAFALDAASLPSGVYAVRAVGESFRAVRQATLLR